MNTGIRNNKRGFTLIELLVVISIISLLASVVFTSLNSARAKARDAKVQSDIHQITLALQLARDVNPNNQFPGISGSWQCLKPSGRCWNGAFAGNTTITNALAPYMASIPSPPDPSGTYMYDSYLYLPNYPTYLSSSPPGTYIIYALETNSSGTNCNGYFAGSYDPGYYYCFSFIDGL